jgi:hypothetical protein
MPTQSNAITRDNIGNDDATTPLDAQHRPFRCRKHCSGALQRPQWRATAPLSRLASTFPAVNSVPPISSRKPLPASSSVKDLRRRDAGQRSRRPEQRDAAPYVLQRCAPCRQAKVRQDVWASKRHGDPRVHSPFFASQQQRQRQRQRQRQPQQQWRLEPTRQSKPPRLRQSSRRNQCPIYQVLLTPPQSAFPTRGAPSTTHTSRRVSFTPALSSEAIVLLFLLDRAPILLEDLAISPATIGRRLMRTQLRPTVPLTLSRRLRPANNAHMNRGTIPPDESLALDPLPCHAVAAGPGTVDDGPLEGEPLARSAVHHFDQNGPSLQAPGSIDHDVDDDDDDSVTIEAFAEAFLNDDSQSVSSQFDSPSRPILDDSPPLSVSSPAYPYCPTTVAIARSIQKHISVRPLQPGATATPTILERPIRGSTLAGTIECFAVVYLRDDSLPELDSSRRVDSLRAFVFKEPCNYDLILGLTLPPSRSAGLRIRSPSSPRLRRALKQPSMPCKRSSSTPTPTTQPTSWSPSTSRFPPSPWPTSNPT